MPGISDEEGRDADSWVVEMCGSSIEHADLGGVPEVTWIEAPRHVPRVDYERIFVLDEAYNLLSEYVLNGDCPLQYEDLRWSIPLEGMKSGKTFFRGEYAFTPFLVDGLKFVILSRGAPRAEERGFIGSLLAAAKIHLSGP